MASLTPLTPTIIQFAQAGNLQYEYDAAYIDARYEVFDLRVVHRRRRTGFEDSKEFPIRRNDLIAGRYQVCFECVWAVCLSEGGGCLGLPRSSPSGAKTSSRGATRCVWLPLPPPRLHNPRQCRLSLCAARPPPVRITAQSQHLNPLPLKVMDFLGSAAFSQAVQALDVATGGLVCLKIIKNNKDYFDQSLDEIKLLRWAALVIHSFSWFRSWQPGQSIQQHLL